MTEFNESVEVASGVSSDGSYQVEITLGPDAAFALTSDAAVAYAVTVVWIAATAMHEASLLAALTGHKISDELGAEVVADLRADRGASDHATHPLTYVGGVSVRTRQPFVHVLYLGQRFTQWDPLDCFNHALYVLVAARAAVLDDRLFKYLTTGTVGIEDAVARVIIHSMQQHMIEMGGGPVG
jgi:hypothetical protein